MGIAPESVGEHGHVCRMPSPRDLEGPEGHVCECGKHWIYQPAHWEPLLTLEERKIRQAAGTFLRGIIPSFWPSTTLSPGAAADADDRGAAVIVPLPRPITTPLDPGPRSA